VRQGKGIGIAGSQIFPQLLSSSEDVKYSTSSHDPKMAGGLLGPPQYLLNISDPSSHPAFLHRPPTQLWLEPGSVGVGGERSLVIGSECRAASFSGKVS